MTIDDLIKLLKFYQSQGDGQMEVKIFNWSTQGADDLEHVWYAQVNNGPKFMELYGKKPEVIYGLVKK